MPVGSAEPQVLDDRGRETKHVPPALPSRDDLHASNDYFAINAERNLFALAWKRGRLRRLHREIDVLLMIRPYT